MRQAGGGQADLRIFEAFAGFAEHLVGGDAKVIDDHGRMAARHRTVDRVRDMLDADRGVGQVDQEHARAAALGDVLGLGHDDADAGPFGAGDEAFAAVDDPVVAVEVAGRPHHRRVRSRATVFGGFGHEKGRSRPARDQRIEEARLEVGAPDLAEQVHIALVGRHRVACQRTERGEAARDQDDRRLALVEVAAVVQNMRGQHPGSPRALAHLHHQFVGRRAMMVAARVAFIGNDLFADESLDPVGDGTGAVGDGHAIPFVT